VTIPDTQIQDWKQQLTEGWGTLQSSTKPDPSLRATVEEVVRALDSGQIRVAEPDAASDSWRLNEWAKQAILLYFHFAGLTPSEAGPFEYYDKIPVKKDWARLGVRVVPPATVRYGAYIAPDVVLMPCYVNIGARIGPGTMIDTWSTVGSCAQIGENCHISGGVGIGGVLEPLQAAPVIVEDNVFIGARSEVAEGCRVGEGAVLAMGCYLGASTRIYNAMTREITFETIPPRAVVVPGTLPSRDGTHETYALIIKKYRDAKTDARTALNDLLRQKKDL
jgi:2,3,4,5-tetrahydropyridine-2-carboxylate N-succinyltransferase